MSYNTYCYCWQITREDSTVFRYTTHSNDLTFLSNTWTAIPSVQPTVIQKSIGLSVNNLEFTGVFGESLDITLDDVRDSKFDSAEVVGYLVNHSDTTDYTLEFEGVLGQFIWNDYTFQSEVRSKTFLLSRGRNKVYSRTCPYVLGDSNCGVTLASHTISRTISAISNNTITVNSTLTSDFNLGRVVYSSGKEQHVFSVSGTTITLWEPTLGSVSDTISVIKGCDKIRQTCKSRFSNLDRFGGFDLIPPEDVITDIGAPGKQGIFDGSSYYDRLT